MTNFYSLRLSADEFDTLVRLLGHHTSGQAFERMFNRMCDERKGAADCALIQGPLVKDSSATNKDLYGDRPLVTLE